MRERKTRKKGPILFTPELDAKICEEYADVLNVRAFARELKVPLDQLRTRAFRLGVSRTLKDSRFSDWDPSDEEENPRDRFLHKTVKAEESDPEIIHKARAGMGPLFTAWLRT